LALYYKNIFKKIRGKDRLMLVVFIGMFVLLVYFIASSHYLMITKSRANVLQKLRAISSITSLQIDGDLHELVSEKYQHKNDLMSSTQDSVYMKLHNVLNKIKEMAGLESPIYTMVYNQASDEYEFIITSSEVPYYRHMFVNYPEELRINYDFGGVIDVYESENGTWLSAFAPIINSNNEVVAIVQVDENFDSFIADATNDLIKNILVACLFFVPFSLFLYSYIKNTLQKEEQNLHMLEESNEEIQLQNELIKESNIKLEEAKLIIEQRNENLDMQVKARTTELLTANEDLETFLYRSSHDIQGPIATLKGICNIAKNDGDEHGYLGMINQNIMQLDSRVKSINAVFEVKQKQIESESFELNHYLREIVNEQAKSMNFFDLQAQVDIDESLVLKSDRGLFKIIIGELTKNSINFRNGNRVQINVKAFLMGFEHIKLVFEDNGQGISEEVRDTIFEMFKRGNEKSQGSGLGLYAVRLAVSKLHGKVNFVGNVNSGTAFQIILPTH
jgi:signal transduction histidine kinase